MALTIIASVEATKGQTKRYEKNPNNPEQLELLTDKKPKWLTNYGYVVDTYQADGDELDCFILGKPIEVGRRAAARPVAVVRFKDGDDIDDKLVCVTKPYNKVLLAITMHRLVRMIKKTKNDGKVLGVTTDPKEIEHIVLTAQALYNALIKEGI